jgi:hypothetical protein
MSALLLLKVDSEVTSTTQTDRSSFETLLIDVSSLNFNQKNARFMNNHSNDLDQD